MQPGMAAAGTTRRVISAGTLVGDKVVNPQGEGLGSIEEIMLDLETGDVAYAVLSFGGFLGLGDKLFAVPFGALEYTGDKEFILDISKEKLEQAPGFAKDAWPNFADPTFGSEIHTHYDEAPYWERGSYQGAAVGTSNDAEVTRERLNQPDLPEELRRRPIDVTKFPGHEKDSDLKTADPSRSYAVTDTATNTRK